MEYVEKKKKKTKKKTALKKNLNKESFFILQNFVLS